MPNCQFIYLNATQPWRLNKWISGTGFDAVIFHYTFLAQRFNANWETLYEKIGGTLKSIQAVKVMIPHDEYSMTRTLWDIAKDNDVERIYASCYPQDYAAIYPASELGTATKCTTVLTGYVEERILPKLNRRAKNHSERLLDIGYRALESTYQYGSHGQVKSDVAKKFQEALQGTSQLKSDIKLTHKGNVNTLVGNRWFDFLQACVAMPGCLGGSSLLDIDGTVHKRIAAYVKEHPDTTFEQVSKNCYGDADGKISTFLLGPRHFECAMTQTCQLLVEGDYHGILQPHVHYVEIKRDFSNLRQVLETVEDKEYCRTVAERCYKDVVLSGRYTYRKFANQIVDDLQVLCKDRTTPPKQPLRFRSARLLAGILNRIPSKTMLAQVPYHWYCHLEVYSPKVFGFLQKVAGIFKEKSS